MHVGPNRCPIGFTMGSKSDPAGGLPEPATWRGPGYKSDFFFRDSRAFLCLPRTGMGRDPYHRPVSLWAESQFLHHVAAMPYWHVILPEQRLGYLHFSGSVWDGSIVDAASTLVDDPAWEPGFTEVWDGLECTLVDFSPDGLKALLAAEQASSDKLENSHTVIISQRKAVRLLTYLFSRRARRDGRTWTAVGSRAEACALLGLDALPQQPIPTTP